MSRLQTPGMPRLAMASVAGTALEYYDFAVYNTLAALVFNKLFFPTFDPLSGTLLSFATFWVGYLSRPFGGILFGHLGDRHGRRFVLVITLALMGITTTLIGLLPTYAQVGALAPILLVALRFVQGVVLGGEWAGAVLLSVEHGSDRQRGRNASFAQMGPSIGSLVATGVIALTSVLIPPQQWIDYGWRIPLLASVALVVFGLWLRVGVTETPQFTQLQQRVRAPLGEVVRHHWRQLIIAGGVRMGPDVMYSLLAVFMLSYITTTLGMSRTLAVTALTIGAAFNAVFILAAGVLSDRFGRRAVYGAGAIAAIAWVWTLFPLVDSKTEFAIVMAIVSGLSIHAFMYGPQGAFIAEQFPTQVRYAGSSLAYTLGGVFAGGIAPLAFQALYRAYGTPVVVAIYATGALLVTLAILWLARPKIVLGLLLVVVATGGALHYFRDAAHPTPVEAKAEPSDAPESAPAPVEPPPRHDAPATEVRKVTTSSDPFEFIRSLARSAFDGDGRAQFVVSRELEKCESALSLVRNREGDPEAIIREMPDSRAMTEHHVAEYRRCVRLMKEDPFAELPPREDGYTYGYWMQRSMEAGYPLAIAYRSLNELLQPPADEADAAETRKMRDESVRELTKATVSGEPDVALTIGMVQSWSAASARTTTASAWMLAACRLGADCGASSKIYPLWTCPDPGYCDVERELSRAMSPEKYADAYAQSQVIEEALRNRDSAAIKSLLEQLVL